MSKDQLHEQPEQPKQREPVQLQGAFNCVLASVYNYLTHVHHLRFPFEAMIFVPDFFRLDHFRLAKLVMPHPEKVASAFLHRLGLSMVFPVMRDLDDAIDYADWHTRKKGVLPCLINLRYAVMDPTHFDDDCWNTQVIVGREEDGRFRMFDQYHAQIYHMEESHLRKAIQTTFNYRMGGQFTPFLTIPAGDVAAVQEKLPIYNPLLKLTETIGNYPLLHNLSEGLDFIRTLRELYLKWDGGNMYDEIYRVMGFQMIIEKSRGQFRDYVRGLVSAEEEEQETSTSTRASTNPNPRVSVRLDEEFLSQMDDLVLHWERFNKMLPMTIGRKSTEEYDRLAREYEKLIRFEHQLMQLLHKQIGQTA